MSEPVAKKPKMDCPYDAKEEVTFTPTIKAYKNVDFLNAREARPIRILCEFEEPRQRLRRHDVEGVLLFCGSSRILSEGQWEDAMKAARKEEESQGPQTDEASKESARERIADLERVKSMCRFYDIVQGLSARLTSWVTSVNVKMGKEIAKNSRETYLSEGKERQTCTNPADLPQQYVVCSGGGPGLMEAANKGALSVSGAKTMGMETTARPLRRAKNEFVTPGLAFEFHYSFTRKFWMFYQAKAIIICPGGFGTLDEFFEATTLRQTGKLAAGVPIVLIGVEFWNSVVNFKLLADLGVISDQDVDTLLITDDVEEAFKYITTQLSTDHGLRMEHAH